MGALGEAGRGTEEGQSQIEALLREIAENTAKVLIKEFFKMPIILFANPFMCWPPVGTNSHVNFLSEHQTWMEEKSRCATSLVA